MGKKVCFVGFAASSREWANDLPDDWEIWGSNECHYFLRREPAKWFQIHPRNWEERRNAEKDVLPDSYGRKFSHLHWLTQCECPVYQQAIDPRIPNSTLYPYEEIAQLSSPLFLTSTLSYMVALAVLEHIKGDPVEAYTWAGIELALGTEYFMQRECFAYWAGRLEGLGAERVRPQPPYSTQMFAEPVYAKDYSEPLRPMRADELFGRTR